MSRQDANAAFALSSFLQGTNATYIDEIYARYENDPSSVDSEWQEFFKSLKDTPSDVRKNAEGPSWARSNWPVTPQDDLTSALDGNWVEVEKVVGKKLAAKAQDAGSELASTDVHQATRDSVRALDADPRLPDARAFSRQARSARHRGAARPRRARSALLWLCGSRLRPEDFPRSRARSRIRHLARDRRDLRAHLLPDARRRVHAYLQRRAEVLDSGAHRGTGQGNLLHPRGPARDPQQAGRGRRLRKILRRQIHRHQALRSRRR